MDHVMDHVMDHFREGLTVVAAIAVVALVIFGSRRKERGPTLEQEQDATIERVRHASQWDGVYDVEDRAAQ